MFKLFKQSRAFAGAADGLRALAILAMFAAIACGQQPQGFLLSTPPYWLNMRVGPVAKALDAQLDLKGQGVLVEHVGADGPAEKAGIKPNDVLLAASDKPLAKPVDLELAVNEGKEFKIKLLRGGKEQTVSVTPAKREKSGAWDLSLDFSAEAQEKVVREKLAEIEKMIREKLKDVGADGLRLQIKQPYKYLPPGKIVAVNNAPFPDDLTVDLHKQGNKPSEITVKKGDKTWTAKSTELAQLPDEVRPYVEMLLGRAPNFPKNWRGGSSAGGTGGGTLEITASGTIELPAAAGGPAKTDDAAKKDGSADKGPLGAIDRRLNELGGALKSVADQVEALRRELQEHKK